MRELSELETLIYNDGERLIPGVTHDLAEEVRHRSSYAFWRTIVELDLDAVAPAPSELRIADLGCGVGHGCATLAELPGTSVVGVDVSEESLEYARTHYARGNVDYVRADLREFIPQMPDFDYVVSRGSMEHVPDGLELTREANWRQRLMFEVPYAEAEAVNLHHVIHDVREDAFTAFPNAEVLFQDLAGVTFDQKRKPPRPNVIICVASRDGLPRVYRSLRFPVPAWGGDDVPRRSRRASLDGLRARLTKRA